MKKILLIILFCFTFTLTSCGLFNDDDIKVVNNYKLPSSSKEEYSGPLANDVKAQSNEDLPNVDIFKSVCYAENETILNTYKTGGSNYNGYNVNDGNDYYGNKSKNNYDLYVPNNLNKNEKHVVILFIHGGAWISGFKTDVNEYVYEFAKRGYIAATIKYTLLNRDMNDKSLSIFRNLDEIDACIKSIKKVLGEDLGFDTTKTHLVIGGASSGAHLSMLYSYSRGNASAIPLEFVIDAVGPVDIKPNSWQRFKTASDSALDAGLTASAINAQKTQDNLYSLKVAGTENDRWNEYQTMRIANGMCGIPYPLSQVEETTNDLKEEILYPNEASNSMTKANGGMDLLSVTYWINKGVNKFPIICAYAGRDSIVGIAQYATLEPALVNNSINHAYIYFRDSDHTEITKEKNEESYNSLINTIITWCQNI